MRVLVACEFSGTVRQAFAALGHEVYSCDLLDCEDGSDHHLRCDVRDILAIGWDLLVAHPPCTRLCNSGARWLLVAPPGRTWEELWAELDEGAALFSALWNAPVERVCVENPIMHRHAKRRIVNYAEPTQTVQPWQYGHGETKRTCLWLRNLPKLQPTDIVPERLPRVHSSPQKAERWRERSRFYAGIAAAMADLWGR